jgi:ribosome-binding protein aMBF1 (putative translation factor)
MTSGEFLYSVQEEPSAYTGEPIGVLMFLDERWKASLPVGGTRVSDRMARLESNPKRAAALARARAKLGAVSARDLHPTLASLRLRAGMSQSQLAQKMGTKQGNVSRWEADPTTMQVLTIMRLAEALGVDDAAIFEIVKASVKESALES